MLAVGAVGCGPGFECVESLDGLYSSKWSIPPGAGCGVPANEDLVILDLDFGGACEAVITYETGGLSYEWHWAQSQPGGEELLVILEVSGPGCASTYDGVYTRIE